MSAEPLVLSLGTARSTWTRDVARWSTSGLIPLDHRPCLTPDELRDIISTGGQATAVLVEDQVLTDHAELAGWAADAGIPVIRVVDLHAGSHAPPTQGAAAPGPHLVAGFEPSDLLAVLADLAAAPTVGPDPPDPLAEHREPAHPGPRGDGRMAVVVGGGGSGCSTVASLLAGALARGGDRVLLLESTIAGGHAVRHDIPDVMPGLPEVLSADAAGAPMGDALARTVFPAAAGFDILLGLRRRGDWTALDAAVVDRLYRTVRLAYDWTVLDADPDWEGRAECGSADVERRNLVSRHGLATADQVVVVGRADLTGTAALLRLLRDLGEHDFLTAASVVVVSTAARTGTTVEEVIRAVEQRPDRTRAAQVTSHRLGFFGGLDGRLRDGRPPPRRLRRQTSALARHISTNPEATP